MSTCKVHSILGFIRRKGKLPTDQFGQILPIEDLMAWFGLGGSLSAQESRQVRQELAVMAEAQQALEELRIAEQLRSAGQS